jgi:glucokinase
VLAMQGPRFVAAYVVDLALGLNACIMLLNLARIVIGGGISKAGDALLDSWQREWRPRMTAWSGAPIDGIPAAQDDGVLYGALALGRTL